MISVGLALIIQSSKTPENSSDDSKFDFFNKIADGLTSREWQIVVPFSVALFLLALLEEFIFRSYLILKAEEKNATFSIIILSTLLFGLGHEGIYPQIIGGFIYSWLFLKYKSILVTGFLHFFFNFIFLALVPLNIDFIESLLDSKSIYQTGLLFNFIGVFPMAIILKDLFKMVGKQDRFLSLLISR